MTACRVVGRWFTETVTLPVERFLEEAVERCEDVRRWVEREVRRRVERHRQRTERRCANRRCRALCLNKLVCWAVSVTERVLEWVVEVVGEWVVETACRIVVRTVKVIIDVVTSVVRFVVTAITCLFTEPRGALDALVDLWFDLVGAIEQIGGIVDDAVAAAAELLEITGRAVREIGKFFGPVGRVVFGAVAGLLDGARQVVEGVRDLLAGAFGAVTGLARLDWCAAGEAVAWGVVNGVLKVVPGLLSAPTLGARGVRDGFSDDAARQRVVAGIIDELVDTPGFPRMFPGVGRKELEARLNLDSATWGVRWTVRPRRLSIPSRSAVVDLSELHRTDPAFDLFKVAGYATGLGRRCFRGSRWQVVYAGTGRRVRFSDLRAYLLDGPEAAPDFALVALSKRVLRRNLDTARRKFRTLGLHLEVEAEALTEVRQLPPPPPGIPPSLAGVFYGADETEFALVPGRVQESTGPSTAIMRTRMEAFLLRHGFVEGCVQAAVAVFQYTDLSFGYASVSWPDFTSSEPSIETLYRREKVTGGTWRDSRPDAIMGYVLAHELGHAFGLRHAGHDSFHYVMFQMGANDWSGQPGRMLGEFLLLGGEPRFTLENVDTVWRWIFARGFACLPEPLD